MERASDLHYAGKKKTAHTCITFLTSLPVEPHGEIYMPGVAHKLGHEHFKNAMQGHRKWAKSGKKTVPGSRLQID